MQAEDRIAVGHVARQTGQATVLRDGTPSPLLLGTQIFATDVIVTGRDAQLLVEFADGSTVAISADCQIRIDDYLIAPDGSRWSAVLSLLAGAVRAMVQ
ncbi:MAG TPA: hypothetical protein VFO41_16295, partial [Alphaproteobacteria bacterium]|nr:hypothetical protein [Alphaproteobacteria bacterium]